MDDDMDDIQQTMALITQELLMQQQVQDIVQATYPTDVVGINVMAEVSHRVVFSFDDSDQ